MIIPSVAPETVRDIERLVVPYPYDQAGLGPGINSVTCCVDARCPHKQDGVLGNNIYYQIAGGIHGIASAVILAKEVQEPGSTGGMLSYEIGQTMAKASEQELGMKCEIHNECVAINADDAVVRLIGSDNSADLFSNARLIEPTYRGSDHQDFVDAAARRVPAVVQPEQIYQHYQTFKRNLGRAATAATLWTNNLKAKGFLAIHETGHAFNVRAANETGSPYYVVTREPGLLLAPLAEKLFGVDPEQFIKALGIYHAGVHAGVEQLKNIDLPITKVGFAI